MLHLASRTQTAASYTARPFLGPSRPVGRCVQLQPGQAQHRLVPCPYTSQRNLSCQARRDSGGRRYRPDDDEESKAGNIHINLNGSRVSIPQEQMWMLAVPAVMVLGLAAFIGPLIIGIAMAAVAVGAAVSIGAFAMSFFWLPFMAMFGLMFMTFGGFTFGAVATVGLGLLLPKLLSLAIALGGVGLGWSLVHNVLPKTKVTVSQGPSTSSSRGTRSDTQEGPTVQAEVRSIDAEEAEVRRQAAELREFDRMMAEAEEKRRVDEWRRRSM